MDVERLPSVRQPRERLPRLWRRYWVGEMQSTARHSTRQLDKPGGSTGRVVLHLEEELTKSACLAAVVLLALHGIKTHDGLSKEDCPPPRGRI